MKKIIYNQRGVTLIETVAAAAIIVIIMITVLGALLYGQKMVVFTDTKNNAASQAQELIDNIMTSLSKGIIPTETGLKALNVGSNPGDKFAYDESNPKQYYYSETVLNGESGYDIHVRIYYNNGQAYVDLSAFAKKHEDGDLI